MANIKGITIEIGGNTTKLVAALRDVDKQVKDTQKELREVDKLLKMDPGNTELLTQKQKLLTDAIEATKDKLDKEKTALEQLKNADQNETTKKQQENLKREIEKTTQELQKLEGEYKNFGSIAGQQLQVAGQKMQDTGKAISGAGRAFAPVSTAVKGFGITAVDKFAEVDKTMQLTNATMKNSEEDAKLLNKAMREAASNSTFGMKDAANASLNFARAGLDAKQAAAALAPAMNLAAGEGGNLDTVSAGLVATINGFRDSFENTGHYADVFAAACNNSALDVDSLSGAMSVAAPIFKTCGKSVDDAALFMGVMANNGIEASVAANALKTGLARIADPAYGTKKALGGDWLRKLGIELFNANGKMKDSVTVQKLLHDAFAKLSEKEQIAAASAIFGKNQMAAWLALINTAPADVHKLNGELDGCTGTTDKMAEAMMNGFGGSLEKVKSGLDVLMTTLGQTIAKAITPTIEKIQSLVDWFNSLEESDRQLIVQIGLFTAAIAPVLIITGQLITAIGGIVSVIGTLFSFIAVTAIPAIGGFIAAWGPVIAILGLVVAAIVGLYNVIKNWDTISKWFMDLWDEVCKYVKKAWDWIVDTIKKAWEGIVTFFSDSGKGFVKFFSDLWNTICEDVKGAWDWITGKIKELWESIVTWFSSEAGKSFVKFFSDLWNTICEGVKSAWEWIVDKIKGAWEGIVTYFSEAGKSLVDFFANLGSRIWDAVVSVFDKIIGYVQSVISWIKEAMGFSVKTPKVDTSGSSSNSNSSALQAMSTPVSWYKKAMDDAYILNSPTIFGMSGGKFLGGGESGSEAVVGTAKLAGMIKDAVSSVVYGGTTVIPVYIGQERIEEIVVRAHNIANYRSGGR